MRVKIKSTNAKIITVAAVIFAVLLVIAMIINLIKFANVTTKEQRLKKELARINSVIEQNQEEIDYKSTDDYVEKYVRDYLNMVGKNEKAFKGK